MYKKRAFRSDVAAQELVKQPAERLLYSMEFTKLLCDDEIITSIDSIVDQEAGNVTPPGLTLEPGSVRTVLTVHNTTRQFVDFFISGGTDGEDHRVQVRVTTSMANIRVGDGPLLIRDR